MVTRLLTEYSKSSQSLLVHHDNMVKIRTLSVHGQFCRLALIGALSAGLPTSAANAATPSASIPVLPIITSILPCILPNAGGFDEPRTQVAHPAKAVAILGGQMSALERINAQQATPHAPDFSAQTPPLTNYSFCFASTETLSVATTSIATVVAEDTGSVGASLQNASFLDTSIIPIGDTPFNDDWKRVSEARIALPQSDFLPFLAEHSRMEQLAQVNRWANAAIIETDDLQTYGVTDYWATADEALRAGQGDCEDFAILKYQALLALGFHPDDMWLTLARDTVRRADHALLIVRVDGQLIALDNSTDAILAAHQSHDYRPVFSYSGTKSWIHGRSSRPQNLAYSYLSVNATSSPRVMGLNR